MTGRPPFPADSIDTYRASLERRVPFAWSASVPRRVRRVVERGMADRDRRFESVEAMIDALARAARPRRWIAAAGGAGLIAAAAIALAALLSGERAPSASCAVPPGALDGAWDPERRDAARRAFAASDRGHAAETFRRVAARLDTFARRWRTMREEACTETRIQGTASARTLELRDACLDRRRARAAALVDLLTRADSGLVDRAVSAATAVTALDECADVAALTEEADRQPDDPARRASIAAVDTGLDAVGALRLAGNSEPALPRAEALVEAARAAGHAPTVGRALHEAMDVASGAGDARLTASIAVDLLHAMVSRERWREAEALVPVVASQVRLAGDPPDLRAPLLRDQAAIQARYGNDPEASLRTLDAALAACTELAEDQARCQLSARSEIAFTLLEKEDHAGAAKALDEVAAATREVYGADHPQLLRVYTNLATTRAEAGDHDGALAAIAQSRAIAATLPRSMPSLADVPLAEGWIWMEHGDCARAVPPTLEARDQLTALFGDAANEVIVAEQRIGECLQKLGRIDEALPHLERWAQARRAEGARPEWRAEADFALARALWARRGQRARAMALARGAIELYAERGEDAADRIAAVRAWLAAARRDPARRQVGTPGRLRGREMR